MSDTVQPAIEHRPSSSTSRSLTLRRLRYVLFGYDFFISYAQSGGKTYARRLERALAGLDFAVFRDETEISGGGGLFSVIGWSLRRSKCLIVVGTNAALDSKWVADEIHLFRTRRRGRPIIIIDLHGVEPRQKWFPAGEGVFRADASEDAGPGQGLLDELTIERRRWRVNRLARWALAMTGAAMIGLASAAAAGRVVANSQKDAEVVALGETERHLADTRRSLASSLWHQLTLDWNSQSFGDDQLNAAWRLRTSDPQLVDVFQQQLVDDPRLTRIVGKQPFQILHASGLSWPSSRARDALTSLVRAISTAQGRDDARWMAAAGAELALQLQREHAVQISRLLAERSVTVTECQHIDALRLIGVAVHAGLSPQDARPSEQAVRAASNRLACGEPSGPLLDVLRYVERGDITPDSAGEPLAHLVGATRLASEEQLFSLGVALREALRRSPSPPAMSLPSFGEGGWEDRLVRQGFDHVLGLLIGVLPANEAAALLQPLLEVIPFELAESADGMIMLNEARELLARRLSATQIVDMIAPRIFFDEAAAVSAERQSLEPLAKALSAVSAKTGAVESAAVAPRIIGLLTQNTGKHIEWEVVQPLGKALSSFIANMSDKQRTETRAALMSGLATAEHTRLVALLLATAAEPMGVALPAGLLPRIMSLGLSDFRVPGLRALLPRLGSDASMTVVDELLRELTDDAAGREEVPSYNRDTLRELLDSGTVKLDASRAKAIVDYGLLEAEHGDVALLAHAARHLGPDQIAPVRERLVRLMASTLSLRRIPELAIAFKALPGQPSSAELDTAVSSVKEAFAWASTPGEATAAAKAFVRVASRPTPERFAADVLEVMKYPAADRGAMAVLAGAIREVMPDAPAPSDSLLPFLAWAATRLPTVNLDAPPVCLKPRGGARLTCPPAAATASH